ncbi:AI-2E family transporter [Candidatus Enterococcus willemsii]|uniref:AI-2E family transporter n=1 Tax=Candidatus Enterococcus willemsii TaxID=1857215 RepID=A0ABQ6Z011_9ENTE|nr:AI-2E family transporter [Enterococcus sp. CU12B]KAF1304267.1 AI-2E family transporter [Enterococcus sp. CU12B]
MKKIKIDWNYWIIRFLFLMVVILGYKFISNYQIAVNSLRRFIQVLSPFIMGFVLAYLLNGAQKRLEMLIQKFNLPFLTKRSRGLSILVLYLVAIYLVFVALNYVIPIIIVNVIDLIAMLPAFYNYILEVVQELENNNVIEIIRLEELLTKLTADYSPENVLTQWTQALTSLGAFTKSLTSLAINSVLALIISIYTLLFKDAILDFIAKCSQKILSEHLFESSKRWIQTTNQIFYKFISSQFLDACIIAILSTITLLLLDAKFALTLGLLLGVGNMIPYFGAIFASIITAIICFFTGGLSHAIYVLIALIVLQQIDGNIIGPRIMSGALNLNPIIIIISITIGGAYFGILGMFLAVPAAAILKIIVTNWLDDSLIETEEQAETPLQSE